MPTIQTANASESEVRKMTVNEIVSTYPKTINSEQLRIILGISKRKCAWMLQNGVIPCKDTEKKTRRYTIEITDVIHYVNTVSENPYAYFIPPIFSAKKSTAEITRVKNNPNPNILIHSEAAVAKIRAIAILT